jgi:hypothetical protein
VSETTLDKEPAPSLVRRRVEQFLPIVGIIAAFIYAVLRLAYAHFYYPFEVEPEEVGLGQFQIISQSLIGLILIFLGWLTAAAILGIVLTLVWGASALLLGKLGTLRGRGKRLQGLRGRWLARRPSKVGTKDDQELSESSKSDSPELNDSETTTQGAKEHSSSDRSLWFFYGAAIIFAVILALTSFRLLFLEADRASRAVIEDGYTISAVFYRIGTYRIIALNVKASHSTVEWKTATNMPSALKRNPQCIVYLGKANGTTVVFNVKDSTTIRFPTNDAVITVHRATDRLSPSCYE